MIKLTVLVKRNPALSVEEFHEEWRAHGRMIADEPVFARYIKRYEQHHRVPADYRNGDTYDGMARAVVRLATPTSSPCSRPRSTPPRCSRTRPASSTCPAW